jgi:hypothetical protein
MDIGAYSPYAVTGLSPATQQRDHSPAGETLPHSTHSGLDKGALPWHPDSPGFWLMFLVAGTVLGIVGASVRVRVLGGSAGANVGRS